MLFTCCSRERCYLQASTVTVNHCHTNVGCIGAESYKLIDVLVVHVSHLKRISDKIGLISLNHNTMRSQLLKIGKGT